MLIDNAGKELSEFNLSGLYDDDVESARVRFGWNEFTTEERAICCKLLDSVRYADMICIYYLLYDMILVVNNNDVANVLT